MIGEDERVFFKVTGTHTVHLTGNYVIPMDDGQARLYNEEDEEGDYDLSPDEEELDALEEDDEEDELDDLDDPRVKEVDSDEEEVAPALIAAALGKGKNKRPAPTSDDDEEETDLDAIMAKSLKNKEPTVAAKEEPKKLSKKEKKNLKKLKKNDGEAAAAATVPAAETKAVETKKEAATTNGEKKVQFAKNLEQGPTPSVTPPAKSEKKSEAKGKEIKAEPSIKEVQGVIIDDRKPGQGPAAKKGNKIEMRYIGKLENGKIFDGKYEPEEALSADKPNDNSSANGAGANTSSRNKKRTKKANPSGSNSVPAK